MSQVVRPTQAVHWVPERSMFSSYHQLMKLRIIYAQSSFLGIQSLLGPGNRPELVVMVLHATVQRNNLCQKAGTVALIVYASFMNCLQCFCARSLLPHESG
eukprot:TRINITY_DN5119_c3_g2_i1.p2 TRINITY_DN5119_c3_g2~~TRINITY_DN5119_c3_g2_i1.p2  ORF type:complete len:101 (-),score=10.35 TRINITY_DN5119_c3_g2_i1:192-494(-)